MIGPMIFHERQPLCKVVSNPQYEVATSLSGTELVTNGTFATDLSGWTAGTGWSFSGGRARATSLLSGVSLYQSATLDTSKVHRLSFSLFIVSGNAWTIKIEVGGMAEQVVSNIPTQGARTYYFDFIPTVASASDNIKFTVWTASGSVVDLDDVSLREATATKTIAVSQWTEGIFPAKGQFDAPTDAQSPWWIGF